MKCKAIRAENFRNISSAEVRFSDGVNLLLGDNAQGKTNLLEALFFFSLGKSFRGAKENEFIRFGGQDALLSLDFEDSVREQNLTMSFRRDRSKFVEQNGVKITKLSEMIGIFRAVLFCPEHLNIIKEGPAMRRSYLDVAISQLRPVYLRSLQNYNHVLSQRNKLIKAAYEDRKSFDDTIEFWSAQLAHEAALITKTRLGYLAAAERELSSCFADMTGGREQPAILYDSSFHISPEDAEDPKRSEQIFFEQLMSNHDREIGAGATLWGIHKDDMDIRINGKSARLYASQGQQRSLALGLKIAESAISRSAAGEEPVLLLDDVFSELDASRREYLVSRLSGRQVIMTACGDTADVITGKDSVRIISVSDGTYELQK